MTNFADFLNTLGASDMRSLIIILQTYNNDYKIKSNGIEDIGFNTNSGYVWLLLGDGITIVSCFGQSAEFMTIDDNGNEIFHDTYYEATNHLLGV
jgi:hypothetical protein